MKTLIGRSGETDNCGESVLAQIIEARHALFDNPETAVRDEDDLPVERGANGSNLRWAPVLGDEKLDRMVRGRVWKLVKKHPHSYLEPEDIIQRIRLKLYKAAAAHPGLSDDEWRRLASTVTTNELRRFSHRLERECRQRRLDVSRDSRGETDGDGNEMNWRENLDWHYAMETFDQDRLKEEIEEAIGRMSGESRRIIELYYRENRGLRTIAKGLKRPFSSFQAKEWRETKEEFSRHFKFSLVNR